MRRLTLTLALVLCLATAAVTAEARTWGPQFLGGPAVKAKPGKIGVGAKGVWQGLDWRRWGRSRATARGIYDIAGFAGQPGTGYRSRIFVKVLGRRQCADGTFVYARVRYRVRKPLAGRRLFKEPFSTCP